MPVTEILNTSLFNREINIFKKFHVKIKFDQKLYIEHEIRGKNFWDTL